MDTLTSAPIYQAILWPPLILGLPRQLVIILGVTTLAEVVSWGQIWFLAASALLLLIFRAIAKQDRFIFHISLATLSSPTVLD